MKFETKFNLHDSVWYMKNNKPVEVIISSIEIFYVDTNQDKVTYNGRDAINPETWLDHSCLHESVLFKTKQTLLESL